MGYRFQSNHACYDEGNKRKYQYGKKMELKEEKIEIWELEKKKSYPNLSTQWVNFSAD